MKGKNTIKINENTMQSAIQYYLNNVVLKEPCTVVSVSSYNSAAGGYEISITPVKGEHNKEGAKT